MSSLVLSCLVHKILKKNKTSSAVFFDGASVSVLGPGIIKIGILLVRDPGIGYLTEV